MDKEAKNLCDICKEIKEGKPVRHISNVLNFNVSGWICKDCENKN